MTGGERKPAAANVARLRGSEHAAMQGHSDGDATVPAHENRFWLSGNGIRLHARDCPGGVNGQPAVLCVGPAPTPDEAAVQAPIERLLQRVLESVPAGR